MARSKTRTNDPVGLRNRVLDAAALAFQTSGFGATSTHEIVRRAGVTAGALHHHFPTKKALALAVIRERVAAEIGTTWVAAIEAAPDAATGILDVMASIIAALDQQKSVSGCPLGNLAVELSLADPDIRAALAHEYAVWRAAIAARIRRDQAEGAAGFAPDPEAFADVVVALVSGALGIAKTEQATIALSSATEHLRRMMRP